VAGKSNSGVSANIKQIKNSIGYIEYSYKIKLNLPAAQIENREGEFIKPTVQIFSRWVQSMQNGQKITTFTLVIGDPEGKSSYPIYSI